MREVDKSREAVLGRINALFDEADRQLDEHNARMAREERRTKLVFPDPLTVGINLPEHLVGNSADYRTKKRAPGTNKDGFTHPEVCHAYNIQKQKFNTQPYICCSRLGHKLKYTHNIAHFTTFPLFPFPLSPFRAVDQAHARVQRNDKERCAHEALHTAHGIRAWNRAKTRKGGKS